MTTQQQRERFDKWYDEVFDPERNLYAEEKEMHWEVWQAAQAQQEQEEWKAIIQSAIGNMEYAAYNLCDNPDQSIIKIKGYYVTESTCPERSLLIAIRDLKAMLTTPDSEGR